MKYIDLFAGVGGFRLGIEKALGKIPQCVYSNEWDKYANSVYRRHYGQCDSRDIRTVDAKEIPQFGLLVGGFPCQSFSVAGRRGGFADTRGTLFFEIARIVKERQPRLLLLENVKGLLSHDKGETFGIILASLDELGYDVQWQVLNSKDFGVPQNRERVFIIGHLRGTPRPEVFPLLQNNQEVAPVGRNESQGEKVYIATRNLSRNGSLISKISGAAQVSEVPHITDRVTVRKITPVEAERLQGFPDGWTEFAEDGEIISDSQRYKMMGNAVTINVVEAIVRQMYNKNMTDGITLGV